MDGGHAVSGILPFEGAVGEEDLDAFGQQGRPKDGHLFALGDAVGGDEGGLDVRVLLHPLRGFDVPRGYVVQHARAFDVPYHFAHIGFLGGALFFFAQKRRIADDVGDFLRAGNEGFPVGLQGVGTVDVGAAFERNAFVAFAVAAVHLVVGEPHGDGGDFAGGGVDFDTVELVHVALGGGLLRACGVFEFAQCLHFQKAHFAVGDDEEVAAAAGGVEDVYLLDVFDKFFQLLGISLRLAVLFFEAVEKQGVDGAADVFLAGVVFAEGAAAGGFPLFAVCGRRIGAFHDVLKQRAEDVGRDVGPVYFAAFEQGAAHLAVEGEFASAAVLGEEFAVDVGKL